MLRDQVKLEEIMRHVATLGSLGKGRTWSSWTRQLASEPASYYRLPRACPTWPNLYQFARGVKRKSKVDLDTLPQGVLVQDVDLNALKKEEGDEVVYPTVIQQVRNNMKKFENCVILTRVGGFYEVGS